MKQIIPEATRIGERSSTLIDHTLCNRNMFLSSEFIPITKTNHYTTSVTMSYEVCCIRPSLRKQRISFLHNEADYSRMLLDFERQLSGIEYNDVLNVGKESFKNVLFFVIQSYKTMNQ